MTARKLTTLGLLTGLALIIFIVELRLPDLTPIPGVKLGLANIITVYAVFRFTPSEAVMLVTTRIILGSIFSGNFTALIYSASGAFLCLVGMLSIRKLIPKNMIWLSSMLGAVLHNTGQILMAMAVMRTTAVIGYFPILVFSGCVAGLFTGLTAQIVIYRFDKAIK